MMTKLLDEIAARMRDRTTDELLAIWNENDQKEWSDDAFSAIKQVLTERGVTLPPQENRSQTTLRSATAEPPSRQSWEVKVIQPFVEKDGASRPFVGKCTLSISEAQVDLQKEAMIGLGAHFTAQWNDVGVVKDDLVRRRRVVLKLRHMELTLQVVTGDVAFLSSELETRSSPLSTINATSPAQGRGFLWSGGIVIALVALCYGKLAVAIPAVMLWMLVGTGACAGVSILWFKQARRRILPGLGRRFVGGASFFLGVIMATGVPIAMVITVLMKMRQEGIKHDAALYWSPLLPLFVAFVCLAISYRFYFKGTSEKNRT